MCNFRKRISFCAWNINGINHNILGDKSSYSDFLNLIKQHDLNNFNRNVVKLCSSSKWI